MTALSPWLPTKAATALTLKSPPSMAEDDHAEREPDSKPSANMTSADVVGVAVRVDVAVGVLVRVDVGVKVRVGVPVGVAGAVGVGVLVPVEVKVGVTVGVLVGVWVEVGIEV